ncbi:antibiotic biosynthesis monooxygenase family protein [Rhodopila sp.]|uniref:antibiotic biosynthesis monooxygenase family protein n=1 Tax=Rhodopila sp. TaxID=2480087 RepID=UPI003D11B962
MFAVIFEVKPRPEAWEDYLGHASVLRPELVAIDGFIVNERYASVSRPGWLVSLSIWRDEKALIRWRTHALHHEIQGKGRSSVLADYHLRVGEITADTEAQEALPQQRFDATEIGASKALTLTEQALSALTSVSGGEAFDSITRPGNGLYLQSWSDPAAAEAGISQMAGRHRVVRVIRDYGMFARAEAPQYFPPREAGC